MYIPSLHVSLITSVLPHLILFIYLKFTFGFGLFLLFFSI